MQIDFSGIEDLEDFLSVPEGTYLCRVADVREGTTREGAPRWAMRLEVIEGDFAGRTAAWDGLSLSERGMHRAKHVLEKLGFDVSGVLDVVPSDLLDRRALVQILEEERQDPSTGIRRVRGRVPYSGYAAA